MGIFTNWLDPPAPYSVTPPHLVGPNSQILPFVLFKVNWSKGTEDMDLARHFVKIILSGTPTESRGWGTCLVIKVGEKLRGGGKGGMA